MIAHRGIPASFPFDAPNRRAADRIAVLALLSGLGNILSDWVFYWISSSSRASGLWSTEERLEPVGGVGWSGDGNGGASYPADNWAGGRWFATNQEEPGGAFTWRAVSVRPRHVGEEKSDGPRNDEPFAECSDGLGPV